MRPGRPAACVRFPRRISPPGETVLGFEKKVGPDAFDVHYGHLPPQRDDKSRVRGANSFALLPAFVGTVRAEIAQQRDYRVPEVSLFEKGTNAGLRLVASDLDAALTVPGSGTAVQSGETVDSAARAKKHAESSGKLFAVRLGECSSDPEAATVVAKNARLYPARYELESGLKRCWSRRSGTITRAPVFPLDLPKLGSSPERRLYKVSRKKWAFTRRYPVAVPSPGVAGRWVRAPVRGACFVAAVSADVHLVVPGGESRQQSDGGGSRGPSVGGVRLSDDPGLGGVPAVRVALAVAGVGIQCGV